MKATFTTVDLLAVVAELKQKVVGLRVVQVYDIDSKTYLFKLQKPEQKCMLLMESGARIHTTDYEWPKSPAPSGFSMKLRKHLRNKRVEAVTQLGVDRIVDLQFGSGEAEYHVLLELYDRGNIILTDRTYTILNILRPRKEGEDVRFAVHENYPVDRARQAKPPPTREELINALNAANDNTPLKKILNPLLDCGGGVLDHELLEAGFPIGTKLTSQLKTEENLSRLHAGLVKAQSVVSDWGKRPSEGYIIKKIEKRKTPNGKEEDVPIYQGFMPILFTQHAQDPLDKFASFNQACDEYFSKMEAARIDQRAVQHEKEVLRKLENVKLDHERRLKQLGATQRTNELQGHLIELNKDMVDGAIKVVRSLVANQIDWQQIKELLSEAQARGDSVALAIKELKLERSTLTLSLSDPFDYDEDDMLLDSDEEREEGHQSTKMRPMDVEIDLEQTAMANARKFFNQKRQAAQKEQKTIDASAKVVQLATKKTNQTLKEVAAITNINKARKVLWFEKFLWFISSENYLVLAGRDGQMNELLVKRHLRPHDIYVHADMHGAASVVVKNTSTTAPPPPKTLHEAGIMALCYSRAWDEKIVTSAWWVWGHQVSKTAPSGEYLTTGSFMVRGKKTFLPPSHLVYGFGFVFRLEEGSIARHAGERRVKTVEEDDIKEDEDAKQREQEAEVKVQKTEDGETGAKSEQPGKGENISDDEKEDDGDSGEEDATFKEEKEDIAEESQFPDTMVEMAHIGGDQFSLRTRTVSTVSQVSTQSGGGGEDEEGRVIYLGDDQPIIVSNRKKGNINKGQKGQVGGKTAVKPGNQSGVEPEEEKCQQLDPGNKSGPGPPKRGQKGKNKKIKKKYQDQDEEERQLRMELLKSAGNNKESKKSKGGKKGGGGKEVTKGSKSNAPPWPNKTTSPGTQLIPNVELPEKMKVKATEKVTDKEQENQPKEEEDEEDEEEQANVADDLNILNALTHIPCAEDEVLYAVPVCAPYTTMSNYRFKVKLTPGPGKKGKACKTAVALFMGDKTTSPREKDLLRAVRDHDLAKNLPGKVKVSAPNITKIKK
ncbi:hypothetical protein Pmani_010146 [Petrolisthes manimaculis]|uniref:Nuclear export mediator factor NEMF n=1 Tax=Petrolisthes manimaculis TaxID=1843537 RepID=A0AAE1Q5L1_9EUCA|nr:hypothetical protein Pmani_010146 [Petrolisthes manimaculis]